MKIRRYETLFLLNSDISEEEITEIQKKCTDVIDQMHGRLLTLSNWGYRQLAFEIKGQNRGFYFLMDCAGQPEMLAEVERLMGLDERVFRYMTIVLEKIFDEEKYEQDLAKKEEAERKAREESEARQAALEAEAKAVEEAELAQAAQEAQAESAGEAEEADEADEATSESPAAVEEAAPEANDTQDAEPDQETTDPASN